MNITPEIEQQIYSILSHQRLELHILPTEQCNFRCVYCYEDFLLPKMKRNIVDAIKKLIEKRMQQGLKLLNIAWFGGEPLAAKDIVFELCDFSKAAAMRYDCLFTSGMTTNGYSLTPNTFERLIGGNVAGFQISLDGPELMHDQTRRRADGSGTFKRIWEHLNYMASTIHHFEVVLRLHVTPKNFKSMIELIEKIKIEFKCDPRFKIFLKAIANLGGPHADQFETFTGKTRQEAIMYIRNLIQGTVPEHFLQKRNLGYICYAASPNSIVIRPDGSIAKCTVAFTDDRNRVGKINDDGTLTMDHEKIKPWLRGLKDLDYNVMGCPFSELPRKIEQNIKSIPVIVQHV